MTRRQLGMSVAVSALPALAAQERPALLGGPKTRTAAFPAWPRFDATEKKALLEVLRSGKWGRSGGQFVKRFEEAYAKLTGAKEVLAVCNGTSALLVALNAVGVEACDEVVVPPYTFIATVNAVLRHHALPVFVDSDPETFQMDARKLEAAVTEETRAIVPVHLGGNVCDMDAILAVAKKRGVPVVEDACQAHLAEWRGQKVGTLGEAGCFSFQASKNLNAGEGGAIAFRDSEARERAFAFHNSGTGTRSLGSFMYASGGANLRLTEFQGALLLAQMTRLEAQAKTRMENGTCLASILQQIPGIHPAQQYAGCTNNAFHLFMFRYDATAFAGLPRAKFLQALAAEGIPALTGYTPLNSQAFLKTVLASRGYRKVFGEKRLQAWAERNQCPANDKLCTEGVWFTQNVMLSERAGMDQIVDAVRKIQAYAGELARV